MGEAKGKEGKEIKKKWKNTKTADSKWDKEHQPLGNPQEGKDSYGRKIIAASQK